MSEDVEFVVKCLACRKCGLPLFKEEQKEGIHNHCKERECEQKK